MNFGVLCPNGHFTALVDLERTSVLDLTTDDRAAIRDLTPEGCPECSADMRGVRVMKEPRGD